MPIGNGGIIGPANVPTLLSAKGVWSLREAQLAQRQGIWPLGVIPDPYFEYTTLLLPGNGTNGAQNNTFLDASTNNFTITRNGHTTQGTFSPFSQTGWGNYFDGSNDYLSVPDNAAWNMGSGNFTAECWIYPTSFANEAMIMGQWSGDVGGTTLNWALMLSSGSTGYLRLITSSNGSGVLFDLSTSTTSFTLTLNTWQHIAAVRSGNDFTIYVNGVSRATTTNASSLYDATNNFTIGAESNTPAQYFTGYISNLRVVKGTAITPPSGGPTAPLTAVSGTSLLTCQSNRFIDNSANNFTITANNGVAVVAFSPFNPLLPWTAANNGGSGYFDGSGDYLTVPAQTALSFAGDFTIETWIYITSNPTGNYGLLEARASAGTLAAWVWDLFNSSGTKLDFIYGAARLTSASTVPINQWVHLVVSRVGSTIRQFINGTVDANTATTSAAINAARTNIYIGNLLDASTAFPGYISGIRVVNGSGVTSVTVPTAPLTAITNTSLLLNFTNAGIYDATSKNDLETVGNAQISTAQSKFGGSSMAFDGTGDWLPVPDSPLFNLGTGDFTIEGWIYPTSSTTGTIVAKRANTSTQSWLQLYYDSTNKIGVVISFDGSTWGINSVGTINVPLNSWAYFALVRSGSSFKTYINGTQDISATNSGSIHSNTAAMTVGAGSVAGGQTLYGYIDDLRITRYARTITASPTAPFPVL
jgi:hypothetical protein